MAALMGGACYSILNVDSKKLNIKSNTIDLVITSPPYLTRIDYAVSTRLELEIILGNIIFIVMDSGCFNNLYH